MSLGEIAFYFAIVAILFALFSKFIRFTFKTENDYNKKMMQRLEDPFLYDRESGTRFTLEQIKERTSDIDYNDDFIPDSKQKIPYYGEDHIEVEQISTLLKSQDYKSIKLSQKQIKTLNKIESLSSCGDWGYDTAFDVGNSNLVLFSSFQDNGKTVFANPKILFWLKIPAIGGHYFLRKKDTIEKVFDLVRNDDEFNFGNFEVFSIKSTKSRIQLLRNLAPFEDFENIEIEVQNDNMFIKTTDDISVESFKKLFSTVEK